LPPSWPVAVGTHWQQQQGSADDTMQQTDTLSAASSSAMLLPRIRRALGALDEQLHLKTRLPLRADRCLPRLWRTCEPHGEQQSGVENVCGANGCLPRVVELTEPPLCCLLCFCLSAALSGFYSFPSCCLCTIISAVPSCSTTGFGFG
jgi:hypothetical protein